MPSSIFKVIVLRGVSGAGKTTLANTLSARFRSEHHDGTVSIFSADSFFTDEDGSYEFDWGDLEEAHDKCLRDFSSTSFLIHEMISKTLMPPQLLIVDNTNTTYVEIAPYCAIAKATGAALQVETLYSPELSEKAHKRNTHGTPLKVIIRQAEQLEQQLGLPHRWPQRFHKIT